MSQIILLILYFMTQVTTITIIYFINAKNCSFFFLLNILYFIKRRTINNFEIYETYIFIYKHLFIYYYLIFTNFLSLKTTLIIHNIDYLILLLYLQILSLIFSKFFWYFFFQQINYL